MVRTHVTGALMGPVVLLLSACGGSGAHVFRTNGIAVRVPVGWHISTRPLSNVTDPVQRFVVSSARLPENANSGNGYVPPSHAVLAQLIEEVPPEYGSRWPDRPARFKLPHLNGIVTLAGKRWAEVFLRDRGRHFYVFVWVGRQATRAQTTRLLDALDGIRVAGP